MIEEKEENWSKERKRMGRRKGREWIEVKENNRQKNRKRMNIRKGREWIEEKKRICRRKGI